MKNGKKRGRVKERQPILDKRALRAYLSLMAKRATSSGRPKAIGYTRVSTGRQKDQGGSLAVQRDRIVEYAVLNGLELVNTFEDALSGARGEEARPGFKAALDAIRSGEASAFIVTDADRFSRDSDNAGHARVEIKRAGGRVVVISEAHAGVEIVAVRQLLAVLEREKIRARMRTWSAARQAKGLPMGRAPYGSTFDPDGHLRPDPATAATVARILSMKDQGATLRAIAAALNADHVPGPTGKPWNLMTVSNLVKRHLAQEAPA
jgi:DNA invertase Pin-like site-specific DNA recombinase